MIRKFLLIFSLFAFKFACAETAEEAFSRELSYLKAQKESLIQLKKDLVISKSNRINKASQNIKKIEDELSKKQLENQVLLEEFKSIEKVTKDSGQVGSQLDKNSLKINEFLSDVNPKLGLSHKEIISNDSVVKFEQNLIQVFNLLESLSKLEWREHAFINSKDQLVKGEILFIGLHSAWGKSDNRIYPLAPYNKDFLKVIPDTSEKDVYLFSSDFQKVNLLTVKTWKERVADLVPGIVMGLIMLAVFSLFIMLAKA